jgi:tRNA(Ile)-lysidine synthase
VSELAKQVEASIIGRKLIRESESVLVAVSGGLDSIVLLHVLAQLARSHKWKLTVAHFNHQLRGKSSDADERLVRATAKKFKLPFASGAGEVKAFSRAHGISLEMAGRKLRHEFLATSARRKKIKTIALAHHADDQVELFFLRLLRGAGSEGLAGMKWRGASPADARVQLVRPLLDVAKSELRAYAKDSGTRYREDATNAQLDVRRNRIRRELVPLLEKAYQPALRRVILRAMEMLGAEAEFVKWAAEEWLKGKRSGRKFTERSGGNFTELPLALQRECLEMQLRELRVSGSYGLIEELREAANTAVTVGEGVVLVRDETGRVRRKAVAERVLEYMDRKVEFQGEKGDINCGKMLIRWELGWSEGGTFRARKRKRNCETFDAEKVGQTVVLRNWRAGDRFQPIGMKNAVKLQDLFVNQKVPRAERHERIVATTENGTIFWVEGMRMAERFKLDSHTTRRLKWLWQRL